MMNFGVNPNMPRFNFSPGYPMPAGIPKFGMVQGTPQMGGPHMGGMQPYQPMGFSGVQGQPMQFQHPQMGGAFQGNNFGNESFEPGAYGMLRGYGSSVGLNRLGSRPSPYGY